MSAGKDRSLEIEHRAIVRSPKVKVEPRGQLFTIADRRNPFVCDRREDGSPDQNLLSRVVLSVGLCRTSKKTIALRAKTGEGLIYRLKTGTDFLRIAHTGPPQMAASVSGR